MKRMAFLRSLKTAIEKLFQRWREWRPLTDATKLQ